MAGDWIGLDHELAESEEVLGIFERTDVEIGTIIGRLFLLWRWFDKMTLDGKLPHVGLRAVAEKCGGDVPFWQAVVGVQWLIVTDDGIEMPDFAARIGKSARARMKEARRKRDYEATRSDKSGDIPPASTPPRKRGAIAETSREKRGRTSENARQLSESESKQQSPSLNKKQTPSSSVVPPQSGDIPDFDAKGWKEVEEELDRLKVALKTKAIEAAKGNGCTAAQVLAWLAWLNSRPGRYASPSGVIFNRMTNPDAVEWDDDQHWPDATGQEAGAEPDRYKPTTKTAQQIADEAKEAQRKREKFLEQERLNAPFIDVLDAMSDEALEELTANDKVARKMWLGKGRDSPDVRPLLLKIIRARESTALVH